MSDTFADLVLFAIAFVVGLIALGAMLRAERFRREMETERYLRELTEARNAELARRLQRLGPVTIVPPNREVR
jgi:hypothetical protein